MLVNFLIENPPCIAADALWAFESYVTRNYKQYRGTGYYDYCDELSGDILDSFKWSLIADYKAEHSASEEETEWHRWWKDRFVFKDGSVLSINYAIGTDCVEMKVSP